MKKVSLLFISLALYAVAFSQDEELTGLKFNSSLYYSTRQAQPAGNNQRYLIDKSHIVVTTDTLILPFVDDFSTNRLRSYKWVENHITNTFYNVFGTCLGPEGIETITGTFLPDSSYSYTFNASLKRFDSTALQPETFTFFGPSTSNCLTLAPPPQNFYYWHPYYSYSYDSIANRVDSVLVITDSTVINYAPVVYFAQGEPGTLWFDNYAYHNYTYPVNPPTLGVATLDGLNEFGLPYNNSSNSTYGFGDALTSKPINLQGINADDSLYLSFFYQPQGFGDYPDINDSLIVEFKQIGGIWDYAWVRPGYASLNSADTANKRFQQVLIRIPEMPLQNSYYFPTFQFRFRNKGSLYGNNDHWHIDYVKLDTSRFAQDTIIQDIAFVYPFPTILKNFTQMPADQFTNPTDLRDSLVLTVHNLDPNANNNPPATNFVKGASELYPSAGTTVASDILQTFNAGDYSYIQVNPLSEYVIPTTPSWPVDSLVLLSTVRIDPQDNRPQNDTLYHTQNFNSVMAYDDGSAEKSYGIVGLGLKKFAYEFNLNQPDTLAAFQVQFSQIDDNVSNLVFSFYAWDSLKLSDLNFDDATTTIYSLENRTPFYVDSVSGFATYKLDSPIIISGKIYFGWSQTDDRRLQIGYDLNSTLGRQHMFYFSNTTWKASTITPAGSPMIRLIFDSNFYGSTSPVIDLIEESDNINLFPNPTSGIINIRRERKNALFEISVMNMMGQIVRYENPVSEQINISNLQNGVYLLSAREITTGKTYRNRIIKTAF